MLIAVATIAQVCAGTLWAALSIVVVLLSWNLVGKSCDLFDLKRVTIGAFWYLTYLAMIFFPAFFVYSDQPGPYRAKFLFSVESVLITVPAGWWIAARYFHFRKSELQGYFARPIDCLDYRPQIFRRVTIVLTVLVFLSVLYMREAGTVPLFYLLRNPGEYGQLVLLREDSFKLLDSPLKYAYALARSVVYPLIILVCFGAVLGKSRRKGWRIALCISLLAGILFAALSLAKAPVAYIVLALGLFLYLFRGGQVSRKWIATLLVLVLLFPITVILAISSQDVTLATALTGTGARLFYLPALGVYYYFEVFPAHVPYLNGRSIGKLSWLLGESYFDTPNFVGLYATPDAIDSVNDNAAFIADLNADFGLWGVILGGIVAGFIMEAIQVYIFRRLKTIVNLAVFTFSIVTFWNLNSVSLPVVLASNGAVLALVLGWALERPRVRIATESPQHA